MRVTMPMIALRSHSAPEECVPVAVPSCNENSACKDSAAELRREQARPMSIIVISAGWMMMCEL